MAADGMKKVKLSSVPPRKINVHSFAEARASELETLHSIVANRLDNNLRSRRNKRRRTTAFDSQAAKKRHRKRRKIQAVERTSEIDQEKVPRRIRRRIELKKNAAEGFGTSGDGTKRLRTHVWHAKRFTMTKLWGFQLPLGLQGRGRGSRALLKRFKNGVLLHDASYYTAIQLEGPEDSLLSVLRMVLVPSLSSQSEDSYGSILSGVTYGTAMLHHVGAPKSLPIAPVTFMWRPYFLCKGEKGISDHASDGCNEPQSSCSHRQLWIWVHAAAFSEAYGALKFSCQTLMNESSIWINCLSLEGQLAKLEILGANAFQLLQKTLHPVTFNSENYWQLKENSSIEVDHNPQFKKSSVLENENIASHSVLHVTVTDPRAVPEKKIPDVPMSASSGVLSDELEDGSRTPLALSGISGKDIELHPSPFPKSEGNSGFSDSSNLWDAGSRVSCPVEEVVLCSEKHHARMGVFFLDDPKAGILQPSTTVKGSRCCPILLLKSNNKMGWSIILPLSWVRVFWIHFVTKGAHAIGLRERRWIACEVGLPHFPSDYPDCEAYASFMAAQAAALDQKEEKLPLAIRPFKIPIPPPWNSVCLSVDKGPAASVQDTQTSGEIDNMVGSNSSLHSNCNGCDVISSESCSNSFVGVIARTCSILTDFLDKVSGNCLLLFPQVLNGKTRILQVMEDDNKLGQSQNAVDHITSDNKLCFLRVVLHAYKKGVFEDGAVVYSPSLNDIMLYTSRLEKTEGGLQIPESSVRSYFKQQPSGKWEVHVPEECACRESHRLPIGFVTTGFVRGSKKPVAEAFCEAVSLARLREEQWNEMPVKRRRKEIYVLVRNLRSSAFRLALAHIVLEEQEDDVEFL